jgi:hypothetical protein
MARATKTETEEVINETPKVETKATKAKVSGESLNKDGFKPGQPIDEKAYFAHIAKLRNKK